MKDVNTGEANGEKRRIHGIEITGMVMVCGSLLILLFNPDLISGLFSSMVDRAYPVIVKTFLTGTVGVAIICSIITGRVLERLGFTDALMRIFLPVTKILGVNPAVVVPSVYNILGDINAAGRIAGPILVKAGATKDEQKIAIATMVQSQQSFSTFMFGMIALTLAGAKVFTVVLLAVFGPLVVVPPLLRLTIWRDTKPVDLKTMPRFTPTKGGMATIFDAAKEGAELLFLLIIPAVGVIFAIIGVLDFIGVWGAIQNGIASVLTFFSIDPETGTVSILASPTLAMAQLKEVAGELDPKLVVGSFVLGASGFPFSVIFGQIPAIWAECTDLNEKEAMGAAVLGVTMRLVTAGAFASLLMPLLL
jgi:spore maturation protein SpmB